MPFNVLLCFNHYSLILFLDNEMYMQYLRLSVRRQFQFDCTKLCLQRRQLIYRPTLKFSLEKMEGGGPRCLWFFVILESVGFVYKRLNLYTIWMKDEELLLYDVKFYRLWTKWKWSDSQRDWDWYVNVVTVSNFFLLR